MREQMEAMKAAEQQKIQQTAAAANEDVVQLRKTISTMREQLEMLRFAEQQKAQQTVAAPTKK